MATFTESDGGDLQGDAQRQTTATAGVGMGIGGARLGLTSMGAPPDVTTGGALAVQAIAHRHRAVSLHGGGAISETGRQLFSVNGLKLVPATLLLQVPALRLGTPPPPVPPALLVSVLNTTLAQSPGSLIAFVANGTPDGPCVFSISHVGVATEILSTTFDDTGSISGISVPVDVTAESTYELVVTDVTESLTESVTFTVTALNAAITIGVPMTTPPSNVQPSSGVRKWVFQDPTNGQVYHFPINPSKMNSPFPPKRIIFQATTAIDGARLVFEGQMQPVEWVFEGTLFTQAQYDAFYAWYGKRNRIWITDHYGRAWLSYLTHYSPTPRRSVEDPWCHEWSITALIFEGPVTPT